MNIYIYRSTHVYTYVHIYMYILVLKVFGPGWASVAPSPTNRRPAPSLAPRRRRAWVSGCKRCPSKRSCLHRTWSPVGSVSNLLLRKWGSNGQILAAQVQPCQSGLFFVWEDTCDGKHFSDGSTMENLLQQLMEGVGLRAGVCFRASSASAVQMKTLAEPQGPLAYKKQSLHGFLWLYIKIPRPFLAIWKPPRSFLATLKSPNHFYKKGFQTMSSHLEVRPFPAIWKPLRAFLTS